MQETKRKVTEADLLKLLELAKKTDELLAFIKAREDQESEAETQHS